MYIITLHSLLKSGNFHCQSPYSYYIGTIVNRFHYQVSEIFWKSVVNQIHSRHIPETRKG